MHNSQQWSSDAFIRHLCASWSIRLLNPCSLEPLLILSMGNAEAVPKQKLMSSAETNDKVVPTSTNKNTTIGLCDTSSTANNEIETIGGVDETMPTEKSAGTNGNNPKPTSSTSTTFSNR